MSAHILPGLSHYQQLRVNEITLLNEFQDWIIRATSTPLEADRTITHPALDDLVNVFDWVNTVYAVYKRRDGKVVGVKIYPDGCTLFVACPPHFIERDVDVS